MRLRTLASVLVLVMLALPALAITYGQPDGNRHPNVGLLIGQDSEGFYALCSGTLISPTVFLTAGHCTDYLRETNSQAYVSFASEPPFLSSIIHGTAYTHPDYGKFFPNTADLGVIVLDQAVTNITPAQLPTKGLLDSFATRRGLQDLSVTVVGYGIQSVRPRFQWDLERWFATADIINLRSAINDGYNIQSTNNPGNGRGGTCNGDSGGPMFLGTSNVIVAVNSFGLNSVCKGVDFMYRLDIDSARYFLDDFVTLP